MAGDGIMRLVGAQSENRYRHYHRLAVTYRSAVVLPLLGPLGVIIARHILHMQIVSFIGALFIYRGSVYGQGF